MSEQASSDTARERVSLGAPLTNTARSNLEALQDAPECPEKALEYHARHNLGDVTQKHAHTHTHTHTHTLPEGLLLLGARS